MPHIILIFSLVSFDECAGTGIASPGNFVREDDADMRWIADATRSLFPLPTVREFGSMPKTASGDPVDCPELGDLVAASLNGLASATVRGTLQASASTGVPAF